MRISELTFIGFQLNGALGSGKYDDISIADVKERIRDGTIFGFLERRLGEDLDLSITTPECREELTTEWEEMSDCIPEGGKLCVDRDGLCLLVAYILQGIQKRVP